MAVGLKIVLMRKWDVKMGIELIKRENVVTTGGYVCVSYLS